MRAKVAGWLTRKYISTHCGSENDHLIVIPTPRDRYPSYMRWEQLDDAFIGFVYQRGQGLPLAACYDMVDAFEYYQKNIVGRTGSRTIDLVVAAEGFESHLLSCFAGSDTPFFWTPQEMPCFLDVVRHQARQYHEK